jgi:retron-type reverse transcriptase
VKLQLQDGGEQSVAGRWVIEGDLASYFDTVHHRLLLKRIRKRIADQRFLALLWKFIKAGCVDRGLFRAASEGVPQGGVISPLLSNIMLHEFDVWMEKNHLNKKARKDRWAWNFAILKRRPITVRENRQWKPAHQTHWPGLLQRTDHFEERSSSLKKKAVDFFSMSRSRSSSTTRASSSRIRRWSALTCTSVRGGLTCSARHCATHRRNAVSPTPSASQAFVNE